ncbi:hypothetical protein PHMEG_0002604 [Phytophthora megakarya]|uniref:Uncharacterized protein n=1 Tax=Phytophthora megakarya TaxID=4795 RepID=A0A225X0B1_9STRA|nr:hypothetical protein PHMEG_0002604 [Phytophthora megakarya]
MEKQNIARALVRMRLQGLLQMKAQPHAVNQALEEALWAQIYLQEMIKQQEQLGYELVAAVGGDISTQTSDQKEASFSVLLEACVDALMKTVAISQTIASFFVSLSGLELIVFIYIFFIEKCSQRPESPQSHRLGVLFGDSMCMEVHAIDAGVSLSDNKYSAAYTVRLLPR